MENEIEIDGKLYKIQSMNVFTQFHVARRLAALAPAIVSYISQPVANREIMQLFYPMTQVLSTMDEDDVNYILQNCMNVVMRKQDNGWAKIQSGSNLMFDDIAMPVMMKLVWEVIQKDIVSFFPTAPVIQDITNSAL